MAKFKQGGFWQNMVCYAEQKSVLDYLDDIANNCGFATNNVQFREDINMYELQILVQSKDDADALAHIYRKLMKKDEMDRS